MKKTIKFIIVGIIVLAITGVLISNALSPLVVETVSISPTNAQAHFTERGHIRQDNTVSVFSTAAGEILSVDVIEGQTINEGDVIVVVDIYELAHEIAQIELGNEAILALMDNLVAEEHRARNNQRASRSALLVELDAINVQEQIADNAENSQQEIREASIRVQNILIEQGRRDVLNAQRELEQANELFEVGAIPGVQVDAAEQLLQNLEAALDANVQRLDIINSETNIVDQSEYFKALRSSIQVQIDSIDSALALNNSRSMLQYYETLLQQGNLSIANLERMIENSTVTSPVSGTIAHLHVNYTNMVNPAVPVAEIRTQTDALVEVYVSTIYIDEISLGDSVELMFTRHSGNVIYKGTIYEIADNATATVSVLGVEERRVRVLVEPDAPSESFRSGFNTDVRFVTFTADDVAVVPRTAIFEEDGQAMLFVVRDGIAVATAVELGTRLMTEIVVRSGISFGDEVIRNARMERLQDGSRVVIY
jgi:HlyD family secretion protein